MKLLENKFFKLKCIFILILSAGFNYPQDLKFQHLTVEDGLANNQVYAVIQDRYGFMWFGTNDGLNRYDGYNLKVFRNDPNDSNSISDNTIRSLFEDKRGNIWIGTKSGALNKYDPLSEKFTKWKLNPNSAIYRSIKSIYEDSNENIWVGTHLDGLFKLNTKNNTIKQWKADTTKTNGLSHNYITSIIEDNNGNILIGTYNGLNIFNPDKPKNGFETFYHDSNNSNSLSSNIIWGLSKSTIDSNIIWIGTFNNVTKYNTQNSTFQRIEIDNSDSVLYGGSCEYIHDEIINGEKILWVDSYGGLSRINLTTGKSTRFIHRENNSQSLIDNQINQTLIDNNGIIWCGTEKGISYSTPKSSRFNSTIYNSYTSLLKDKEITVTSKFDSNRVWIGTNEGLYLLDSKSSEPDLKRISKLDGYSIYSLEPINDNEIWIGTFGQGLKHFNYAKNKITNWDLDKTKFPGQSINFNQAVFQDSKKNIWIGYSDAGIVRLNPKTGKFKLWQNEPGNKTSLTDNSVWVIKEDRLGRIWIGTLGGGLNLFVNKEGGEFQHWLKTEDKNNNMSSNRIYSICEVKKNKNEDNSKTILWLATSNGLNRFEIKNNKPNSNIYDIEVTNDFYTIKDGLPSNVIKSIIEDDDGNLWLGTSSGISFFDVKAKVFSNYSEEDGLNSTEMNSKSALKLNKQFLLFGGPEGLNIFNPKLIGSSTHKPNLIITDFQIFNKSVKIGKNSLLKKSLINTNEIQLTHDQNVFSFEFAALDYNSPQSIKYAYKMEGFDKDWIESGNRRFVTYTNLNHGNYVFKVKSTNADGVWVDNETSINILIDPPWWKTIWADTAFIFLILLGLYAVRRFELNRTHLRNELKLREFEVKQKSQLEEIKSRFFANFSHEFRTPLMLIKGPLEQLKKGKDKAENIELIEQNSERLKSLIDQLLELSQLEKASISLKARELNIVIILKGLISSFESLAKQKNIKLNFENNLNEENLWIDKDKFEKIIINLISNAIKFTPENGNVKISVNEIIGNGDSFVEISISDNGISIPKEKIDKIFDRFFQVDDSSQRSFGGSGIGLSLVKEFVDLHKWKISVQSEKGIGTEFKLLIPYGDSYLADDQKIKIELQNDKSDDLKETEDLSIGEATIKNQIATYNKNKDSILIVEDSKDVRKYLSRLLKDEYQIFEAVNGTEGLITASKIIPDLIISDVMMPSMDGMEFCSRIKSEWQTSDIPIILLTAKASFESKIEGLDIGADEYLTKPFETRELFVRIKNLIEQRKRIRQKYSNNIEIFFDSSNMNTAEDNFIKKVIDLVEKNMDKTNYGTEQLAKELFVSRTKLHRKIIEITGQAPGEFIRTSKLKKAAKLLLENKLSVTQIAYEIGFSSPAQFTRAFSKQFNCVPSEFSSIYKLQKQS